MQFTLTVTRAEWMNNPESRWNNGLVRAGMSFRNGLQRTKYPEPPALSTYIRTFTLAKKANFRITAVGQEMVFGSTYYLPYLLKPVHSAENWRGKRDELIQRMKEAFVKGVQSNSVGSTGDE